MCVRVIRNLKEFDELRSVWEACHEADEHASVFTSWGWLRGWLEATPRPWMVLTAASGGGSEPEAFLPLTLRRIGSPRPFAPSLRLAPAGFPMADRSGLVLAPGSQRTTLPLLAGALADVMRRSNATAFDVKEAADPRWRPLLRSLVGGRFALQWEEEGTARPFLTLPRTWDRYIEGSKKRRAALRKAERDGYFVTAADGGTLEDHLENFLELHQMRLGRKPGEYLDMMRALVRWSFAEGLLHLVVLRTKEGRPVAANLGFLSPAQRIFHAYNGGWDEAHRRHSPRRVLELHSIRWAIERDYHVYDLGRGGEPYKFGLGAQEARNENPVLLRRTALGSARDIARRIPRALSATTVPSKSSRP